MKIHELKTLPEYFDSLYSGNKTFEIRKDDRNFSVNDSLVLKEYANGKYTGRVCYRNITYITHFPAGLKRGYVCMAITPRGIMV